MSLGRLVPGILRELTPGLVEVVVGFTGNGTGDPTGVEGKGVTAVRNGAVGKYRITITGTGAIDVIGAFPSILSTTLDRHIHVEAIDETNRRVDLVITTQAAAAVDPSSSERVFCKIVLKETSV